MPNLLNQRMLSEIESFLTASRDCVVIDITGTAPAKAEAMRSTFRKNSMRMKVVKTSLARLAAKKLGYDAVDGVLAGPTAIIFGGESVADVARIVREMTKGKNPVKVRGGLLDRKPIKAEQVTQLANLPTRPELLAQLLATLIAPMSGVASAVNSMMTAIPQLTKALEDKTAPAPES